MATNNKFIPCIENVQIHPYSPGSKLATCTPGFEHFDDRSHFMLFRNMTHIAVKIDATNPEFDNPRRRRSKKTFFVNVYDVEDEVVISSRSIYIDMGADDCIETYRTDVPLYFTQIDTEKHYWLEVVIPDGEDRTVVFRKEFRFISCVKPLPTRYYTPLRAGIVRPNASDPKADTCEFYKEAHDNIWSDSDFKVVFELEDNISRTLGFAPELYAQVDSDDKSALYPVNLSDPTEDEEGRKIRTATVTIPVSSTSYGFDSSLSLRVNLKSQGYIFATAAFFTSSDRNVKGTLTESELVKCELDSNAKWFELVTERSKEWDLASAEDRSAIDDLNNMVGLNEVKNKVRAYRHLMEFFDKRRKAGLNTKYPPLHAMFLGSPGTGKTTVAKILGRVLKECGVLSSGHVVVKERATLIGQYYSSEAENTLKALEMAKGGILFIDEAYQLSVPSDPKDPGRWVIDSLMTAMADESDRDWMLILAGYTEPTQRLLELNPGLASRIPASNIYNFEDYDDSELMEIARGYFKAQEFTLTHNAERKLQEKLEADYRSKGKEFGNGRHVMNLIETHILPAMATRLAGTDDMSAETLSTIRSCDIPAPETEIQRNMRRAPRMGFVG